MKTRRLVTIFLCVFASGALAQQQPIVVHVIDPAAQMEAKRKYQAARHYQNILRSIREEERKIEMLKVQIEREKNWSLRFKPAWQGGTGVSKIENSPSASALFDAKMAARGNGIGTDQVALAAARERLDELGVCLTARARAFPQGYRGGSRRPVRSPLSRYEDQADIRSTNKEDLIL